LHRYAGGLWLKGHTHRYFSPLALHFTVCITYQPPLVCVCVCVCIYVCVCVFIHNTYSMSQLISVCRIRVCRSRDAGIDGWIILRLLLRSSKFFGFFSHHQIEKLVHKRFKEMEKPLLRKCEYSYKIYNNLTLTICKEWTLNFLILS